MPAAEQKADSCLRQAGAYVRNHREKQPVRGWRTGEGAKEAAVEPGCVKLAGPRVRMRTAVCVNGQCGQWKFRLPFCHQLHTMACGLQFIASLTLTARKKPACGSQARLWWQASPPNKMAGRRANPTR